MKKTLRPIINIPRSPLELFLNVLSFMLLIGIVVYLLMEWSSLSDQVPIHFNARGQADGWGSKGMLWLLPIISILLWIGLTVLEKFPHVYNYLNLTENNIKSQYKNARMMINILKAEITFFFVFTSWQSIQLSMGHQVGLGVWEILVILVVVLGSLGLFIIRSFRLQD